jgi:hypothetical protein
MSLEVRNAQNIAKGIHSKNPLKPTNRMLRSKSKVRGKAGREVVDGEVIEPTPTKPIAQEPEIYDGTIVKELPKSPKAITSGPRMVPSTRITPVPNVASPQKKRKPGYKQMTLPGMGRTANFKRSAPPKA